MARMMMIPPMVGVPFFCCSPARPSLLQFHQLVFFEIIDQFFSINSVVITKDNNTASNTLNVMNSEQLTSREFVYLLSLTNQISDTACWLIVLECHR